MRKTAVLRRCLVLLMALLLCGAAVAAGAEMTVGREICPEDITDFYWTTDASVYPPMYQRYRFCVEDGVRLFYHESRRGGGWPQTEEDIADSGTKVLTEDEWTVFWDCLCGGEVRVRSEEVLDGDDGPWMYLYWTGDRGEYQEFSFASPAESAAFLKLCSGLVQSGKTRYAGTYRYEGGGFGGAFTITLNPDGTYTFYEGPLSSYLGGGEWGVHDGTLRLTETAGFDMTFRFAITDGALIYTEAGSDSFPYVKVSDGERFVRTEQP